MERSRSGADPTDDRIRVVAVDDDPDVVEMTATFLERESDRFDVETHVGVPAARECLDEDVDCIVSDFDMPAADGLAFLGEVRKRRPDLPFVLFTGKGSEEIASEAISAGVTEYMQKSGGTDQYAVLANRIENAVDGYRTERAVERARERFRLLVEEATDVIAILGSDGTIQYVSPSAERVLGWPVTEVEGASAFEYIYPEDREQAREAFAEIVTGDEQRRSAEFRFRKPGGGHRWVEARGRDVRDHPAVDGIVTYVRDITERRRRAAELAETNDRLEAVVEASPLPIVALDEDGTVELWNRAAEEIFGWDAREVLGEPTPLVSTDDRDEFESIRDRILGGESITGVSITRRTADGDPIDLRLSTAPVHGPDGAVNGFMAVFEPIEDADDAASSSPESDDG